MTTVAETNTEARTIWQRLTAALPLVLALTLIAGVWLAGAIWSFDEQTRYAEAKGFDIPELLSLVLDGMAIAMAAVSWAASLDARPAVFARLVTGVAIVASSASNGAWAWTRSKGDEQTIVLAAVVPVLAMLAFEVLLGEVRRQVLRRRGQPGPVAITYPRLVRLVLAPWPTFVTWRSLVLAATDPAKSFEQKPTPVEVVDEDDPGIQLCRRLEREIAAARQVLSPGVARIALADRAVSIWTAPEPARRVIAAPLREPVREPHPEPVPAAQDEPAREPVRTTPAEPVAEPVTDSARTAAATQRPTQRRITERVTRATQNADDRKLRAAHARLTKRLGREPSGTELGAEAGVSKATANRWKSNRT